MAAVTEQDKAVAYIKEHRLNELVENMTASLVFNQPGMSYFDSLRGYAGMQSNVGLLTIQQRIHERFSWIWLRA